MAVDDGMRTRFAMQAVDLAGLFGLLIGERPLTGPVTYHVELSAPEGPSTGGGVQAVQHIKLIPVDGGATLVAGWANQIEKTAELRTLNYLNLLHRQRFGRSALKPPPLPSERIDRLNYQALLSRMQKFFEEKDIRATVIDLPEARTAIRPAPSEGGPSVRFLSLIFVAVVTAVAAALYFALSR
jgi:hypothetical protein